MKKERIIAAAAAVTLMSGTISPGVFASNTESTRISDTSWSIPDSVAGKISYSNSYNPAKWQDYWSNGDESWRDGLVTGNGENGLLEDCAPEEDVMIFQNVKFNYPSGAQRETPELESVMDDARQSLLNDTKSASSAEAVDILLNRAAEWSEDNGLRSGSWKIQNTYAFHPGMQLRLKMNGLNNGDETNYYRYTNYETAEIGSVWEDEKGEWERKSFTSREDNVTVSRIASKNGGTSFSLSLSVDDISDMSNENKSSGRLGDMRYKKFYKNDNGGILLGEVVHYPSNDNSELKNGGYAGVTRVIVKGVNAEITVDNGPEPADDRTDVQASKGVPDETVINVSGSGAAGDDGYVFDYDPTVNITNADEVILITASDRDKEMGEYDGFKDAAGYDLVNDLSDRVNVAAEKYGGAEFDYGAALAPHTEKHCKEFGAVKLDLNADEADRALSNEELIQKQKAHKNELLPAMLERAFYNGRYANVCASGYQVPRLGGIWTGAFEVQWSGDYTTDANINLQVAGNNIGSMPSSSEGFINLILRVVTDWEINAKQVYGIDNALLCPTRTDGDRSSIIHFDSSFPGHIWNAGASWMLLPVYEYMQCFGNRRIPLAEDIKELLSETGNTYNMAGKSGDGADDGTVYNLRNTLELTDERADEIIENGYFDLQNDILYPLLTKTANFWTGLLTPEYYTENGEAKYEKGKTELADGQYYLITPSYSPENTPLNSAQTMNMNSVMDISAARDCFNMASAVAEACGNGSDISKWNEYESKLPPYLYEPTGELKEWALECYEENYEHRHTSQLYGLWPAYEGETDNALFEGARKLIETKNTVLPPTAGDNVAGHGWVHKGLIMARAKSAEGVREALLAVLTNEMYYASMMTSHDTTGRQAYCTDTAITVPAILMESVVYSDSEVIELAPAIPDEMLSSGGNISGLRSRTGDAIENIEWSDEGISAVINADGDVKVKCARPFAKAVVNGEDVSEKLKTDESGESYITVSGKAEVRFVFTDTSEGTYEILDQDDLRLTANGVSTGTDVCFEPLEMNDNVLWKEHTVNGKYIGFENKLYAGEYIDIQTQNGKDGNQLCSWNEDPAASSNRQFKTEERDGYIYIWTTAHEQGNWRWDADCDKVFEDSSGRLVYNTLNESNDAQKWIRIKAGDFYAYQNVGTGRFIELAGPDPGEQMTTAAAGQPLEQLWNVEFERQDIFRLISAASGKVLTSDGSALSIANNADSGTQLWRFENGTLKNLAGYTVDNVTLVQKVGVSPRITADSVEISLDVSELDEGGQTKLNISALPAGALSTGFTWNVSGDGKVNIDDDGTIMALLAGTVEISAAAVGSGVLSNTVSLRIKSPIDGYSKITDYEVVGRTEGKWEQQSPPQNAFDGDISTVYDGQAGGRCGIKMSEPQKITAFRFQSGAGYEERMPGCVFRVSNDGVNYTAVYTISSVKPNGEWNYVYLDDLDAGARELLENNSFTYFDFYGEKYAPIAELDVYTNSEEAPEPDTGFVTTNKETGEITYNIAGYAASLGLSSDTAVTEGTYEELGGLVFRNGEQPLYWVAKQPRIDLYAGGYIAFTATANGTLSVEGASNKRDSARYISIGRDPSRPTETIVIPGTQTETIRAGIQVVEGQTYYIMGSASQVTAVIFTPDKDAVKYSVHAVAEGENIAIINEGILNRETPEKSVCVPRFISDGNGDWYEFAGSPDPFKPEEFSYETKVTMASPIVNAEYKKSNGTVYFAEAEKLFGDSSNTWTGYSGGGFTKGSSREAQTDVIPAGNYSATIGYKGARSAGFAQPELLADGEVILSGDLGVKVTGESSYTVALSVDTALTINTGDRNNEIDYIHIRKADGMVEKYAEEKADDKLSFKDGEVIGFIGDSITHGDEGFESYHEVLYNYLMTHYPDTKLYMKNLGVSSATGKVLLSGANGYSAIDTYLSENPEMSKTFVMLGMNDIDRDLYEKDVYESTVAERAAVLEEYKANLSTIVDKLLDKDIEVILMTPTIYDATRKGSDGNLSNEGLKECAETVKELAAEKGCKYIDLNAAMLEINNTVQTVNPNLTILDAWYDNFHPGAFGNNIMGYLILRQLGEGDEDIVLSSGGGQNSEITSENVFSNYVSYEYTLSKLPMAKTDGYGMADKYVDLTEDLSSMIVKEELDDGVYELSIDGTVLGSYTADELGQGVNIAFNKENPACAAAEAAQTANIERSRYEILLQRAVMWLVFNRYIDESDYNDIIAHKDEYINAVKEKTDEMYSIVNTELAAVHKLEIRLVSGGGLVLPNMFTENMVLQEGSSAVYGKGESGIVYTVTLDDGNGHMYTASDTAENGEFKAVITDAPASMEAYTLTVESPDEKLVIDNVYVGDVYLLSGQSNMEMRFDHSYDVDDTQYREDAAEIAEKYGDRIKFLVLGNKQDSDPQFNAPVLSADTVTYTPEDLENSPYPDIWNDMKASTSQYISLIGMYFAEDILNDSEENKVNGPIGLICTAVGGTDIDTWMKSGSAVNYNGHIAPFEDYGISGVLWYQGEADSETDRLSGCLPRAYKNAFPQLIDEWREVFGEDIPFLYVQLAGYTGNDTEFQIIRDAQRRALDSVSNKNNVAMAVSADTPTTGQEIIHPDGKDIVAERLYRAAKNIIYGDNASIYEGPLPESFEFKGGAAVIHFKESSIAGGLKLKDGMTELSGFKIAGPDRVFTDAEAEISGDTVIVRADGVTDPTAVSYCDENVPELSLYNGAGLPASPFNSMETIQISAIGDSITYGAGLADRSTQCYPAVLSEMLNSDHELSENEYYVSNNGKSGATVTENGGEQYITYNSSGWDNAKGSRADIYTIALGTNDSKNICFEDVQNGKFEEIYLNMIDELMNANKNAVIYLCQPVPSLEKTENDDGQINESRLVTVREKIDDVYSPAHDKYGDRIRIVDLFETFKSVIQGETLEEANIDMYTSPVFSSDADSVAEFNEYGTVNGLYLYNRNAGSGADELFIDTVHPGANGAALIAETLYSEITAGSAPEPTETALTVTDDSGNEIASAGNAAAAGHINIAVSVSPDDSGKELIMYAAQYDESGALINIDMFDGIKDGDRKKTDISPDCGRIALYLWDTEQAPVIGEVELN